MNKGDVRVEEQDAAGGALLRVHVNRLAKNDKERTTNDCSHASLIDERVQSRS